MRSCFQEKFGTPRQPGLVPAATGTLELHPPCNVPEIVRGLDAFSHLWLIYIFHQCRDRPWQATVRPPRLGGNRRVGVFGTRSNFRPNPIGMSVVQLDGIVIQGDRIQIHVSGIDIIDGTPVIDIKPYLPFADCIPDADGAYAHTAPEPLAVTFTREAAAACRQASGAHPGIDLHALIEQVLAQDPRPAYDAASERAKTYGTRLLDLNIRWEPSAGGLRVIDIAPVPGAPAAES
jgi:tRNA-Thr(GGU) m(6)t(6)A37 methyltransferase TsaA